jgi:D-beta-D-heptose 7-phosphate kinase/D-beta-D-heptose 1-phosphate adenosyltransferase
MRKVDTKGLKEIISLFKDSSVLVVGDVMLDEFVWGTVERISPEAPIPVVNVNHEVFIPGAAANVASNIHSLGGRGILAGVIGEDMEGGRLKEELKKRGIDCDGLFVDSSRPTTLKTRVIAHSQQVVRVDREERGWISEPMTKNISDYIGSHIREVDVVVVSDYGKGVITKELLDGLLHLARREGKRVVVDPYVENFLMYKGVSIITPNKGEASGLVKRSIRSEDELVAVGREIKRTLGCEAVIITRGEEGMSLFLEDEDPIHIPTMAREVYDVTGAGDTVVSVLALALGCGATILDAARLANLAAGVVVGKVGTATLAVEELVMTIDGRVGIEGYHHITPSKAKELLDRIGDAL